LEADCAALRRDAASRADAVSARGTRDLDEVRFELQSAERRCHAERVSESALKDSNTRLRLGYTSLRASRSEYEGEVSGETTELRSHLRRLAHSLRDEEARARDAASAMRADFGEVEDSLRRENDRVSRKVLSEASAFEDRIFELRGELETARRAGSASGGASAAVSAELARLEAERRAIRDELQEERSRTAELSRRVASHSHDLEDLIRQHEANARDEHRASHDEITSLRRMLQEAQDRLTIAAASGGPRPEWGFPAAGSASREPLFGRDPPLGSAAGPAAFPPADDGDASDSDDGDRRRRKKDRTKEKDVIELTPLPSVPNFQTWRALTRDAIASASGRGEKVLPWILELENPSTTMEMLSESGRKYVSLDQKLKEAINKIASPELRMKIVLASEVQIKLRRTLKGRQALWIVYDNYKVDGRRTNGCRLQHQGSGRNQVAGWGRKLGEVFP